MSSADEVLDAINQALRDFDTSDDAMRWTPDQPEKDPPLGAPEGWTYIGNAASGSSTGPFAFAGDGSLYWAPAGTPLPDPQPWMTVQRTVCTREDLTGWVQRFRESLAEDEMMVANLRVRAPRQPPPCLGCGRPTGGGPDAALTLGPRVEQRQMVFGEEPLLARLARLVMIATFSPCGCVLEVRERP